MKIFNLKLLSCQAGVTIVEALFVAGLLGAIALGVMKISESGFRTQADLNARSEIRYLKESFYYAIKAENCGLLATGQSFKRSSEQPGDSKVEIKIDINNSGINKVPQLYGRYGIAFTPNQNYGNVSLDAAPFGIAPPSGENPIINILPPSHKTAGGFYYINPPEKKFHAEISIRVKKGAGTGSKRDDFIRFPAIIEVEDGNLVGCSSISEANTAKESCLMLKGDEGVEISWLEDEERCRIGFNPPESSDGSRKYAFNEKAQGTYVVDSQYVFP